MTVYCLNTLKALHINDALQVYSQYSAVPTQSICNKYSRNRGKHKFREECLHQRPCLLCHYGQGDNFFVNCIFLLIFWGNITFHALLDHYSLTGGHLSPRTIYFTRRVAGECFLQKTDISDTWPQIERWHLDKRTISTAQRGAAGARRAAARWNRRQMLSYQRRKFWDRKH